MLHSHNPNFYPSYIPIVSTSKSALTTKHLSSAMELFETLSAMLHTAADLLSATLPWPERDRLDIPIAACPRPGNGDDICMYFSIDM